MTYTLFDLAYRVALELGIVSEGTATGGTTTTTVDATLRTEADDYWNGGTVFILRDAAGASAAPEKEYARVTDFANSTGTITHAALTAAPAAGDIYGVAKRSYPLVNLIQVINQALDDLGIIPHIDTSSLTGASDQTEYTLPVAASMDLRQVWVQRNNNDSDDNRWMLLYNWYIQDTTAGTGSTLVFPYQIPVDYDLKLVYGANHDRLQDYDDELAECIPLRLVVYSATAKALKWYQAKHRANDEQMNARIKQYEDKADRERLTWRVRVPPRSPRIMMVSQAPPWRVDDDVTKGSVL